uniref:Uncharacterized protein n=1 Tax=Solanum tuberosum TaxID=4113 RepID=M1DZE9_SOLTU
MTFSSRELVCYVGGCSSCGKKINVNSEIGDQMDHLTLKITKLKDYILSFNKVEGGIIQLPYAKVAHLLDLMAKTIKKKQKDQGMATLLEQLDDLAQKGNDLEVLSKGKEKYTPPHERRKMKKKEGEKIEEVLLLILHKVDKHDNVLEDIRENVMMLNQMTTSHSLLIQLLGSQMDQLMSSPNLDSIEGWPYENEATPNTEI